VMILLLQACFFRCRSSYPILCQLGQILGVMFLTQSSSLEHDAMRPGM
jgi:hypothetical protein